ncbi:MAG: chorismate-binding protein [Verrucomicrobia bacterium]|nr:chorismate-binding protein [Verrucomicrobiota bacterium]
MYQPTLEEFLKLATQGNLVPVTRRILADFETPLSAYRKIRGPGESFLFESVEGGEHLGRYSFVGCNPRAIIRQNGGRIEYVEHGKVMEKFAVPREPNPFTGGAVGFIGYEFIHDIEPIVPRPPHDELKTPTMYFLIADQLLIFDRVKQTITILVNAIIEDGVTPAEAYENAIGEIDRLVSLLEQPSEHTPVSLPDDVPQIPFESNTPKEKFLANVLKSKEYITAGDIIQVVGSQRFSTPVKASPLDIYRAARSINPSPYMFLLELNGFSLVGASPELHVRCEDRKVEIRPIAGTRRRGKTPEEDALLEKELLADSKERAEHVMLVDLARNDIGRVCEYGSVRVTDLMTIERYPELRSYFEQHGAPKAEKLMVIERYSHVMHIVSAVEGRLSLDKTPYDLMRATFPAGTLTGAPKVRAMQIISEFEQTARGPYGGCVGYFSFNGNLDCCITIRTALIKDGRAYVQAGGGWVNDSVPEAEFQETVNKSKAMLKAVALAETFTSAR